MSGTRPAPRRDTALRRDRNRRGAIAESKAALFLMLRGHAVVARRFKSHVGEIDIVAVRGRRIAFIEVKSRGTIADCEAAITADVRARVRRAAEVFLARHHRYIGFDIGFDLMFMRPWRWPDYRPDTL